MNLRHQKYENCIHSRVNSFYLIISSKNSIYRKMFG